MKGKVNPMGLILNPNLFDPFQVTIQNGDAVVNQAVDSRHERGGWWLKKYSTTAALNKIYSQKTLSLKHLGRHKERKHIRRLKKLKVPKRPCRHGCKL